MAYNPEKHHRRSIRLNGYDYSQPGDYFVTMCTQNRECIFGEIDNGKMKLNDIGQVVEDTWNDLPNHNLNIILDSFIIMPNHFHGILRIVGAGSKPAPAPAPAPAHASKRADLESAPTSNRAGLEPNRGELESKRAGLEPAPTLSDIIRQFKTFPTRYIDEKTKSVKKNLWTTFFSC